MRHWILPGLTPRCLFHEWRKRTQETARVLLVSGRSWNKIQSHTRPVRRRHVHTRWALCCSAPPSGGRLCALSRLGALVHEYQGDRCICHIYHSDSCRRHVTSQRSAVFPRDLSRRCSGRHNVLGTWDNAWSALPASGHPRDGSQCPGATPDRSQVGSLGNGGLRAPVTYSASGAARS